MPDNDPSFSVVIATRDRSVQLSACLTALANLDYPLHRYEVVVVDDGSVAPLDAVVALFRRQLDITLIKWTGAGPAAARNVGAERAKYEILVFTDDDCMPAPAWLRSFSRCYEDGQDCVVGGRVLNALPNNVFSAASQQLVSYLYTYYNTSPGDSRFFCTNNLAVPAGRFREIGGFDTTFPRPAGEDREFCDRWRHHGFQLRYTPDALVHHAHGMTLRAFVRQHFHYGRGAWYFHQVRAQRNQDPIRVEPLAFYFGLLRYPFVQGTGISRWQEMTLLAISQVANASGFFWEVFRQRGSTAARGT